MPEKTLGLDIGRDTIKVVQITGGVKEPRITAFAAICFEGDEGLENALREISGHERFRSDAIITSIDSMALFYRYLKLPFSDDKKIRKVVPFELEPLLPLPIEQLLIDYVPVSQTEQTEILTSAVKRTRIRSHLEMFQKYQTDPKIVDVEGVPLAVSIIEKTDTADGIMLDIGNQHATLVLWKDKTIHLVRSFPFGGNNITRMISEQLHMDFEEAEKLKRSLWEAHSGETSEIKSSHLFDEESAGAIIVKDAVGAAFDRLCVMLGNTIHTFSTQKGEFQPEKIYLTGGGTLVPEAREIISRCLECPAEYADLKANGSIRMEGEDAQEEWRPELMNNALALALRGNRKGKGFNFRQEEFEVRGSLIHYKEEIISAAIALAVIVVCIMANTLSDFYLLTQRYERLNNAIIQVFKETLPDVTRIEKPVHQLKVRISEERKKRGILAGGAGEITVMEILRDISQFIPDAADFKVDTIVFDPDVIQINGNTDNFNTVDSIKNGLQKSSYFESVDIGSAKLDSSGSRVEFKIILLRQKKTV